MFGTTAAAARSASTRRSRPSARRSTSNVPCETQADARPAHADPGAPPQQRQVDTNSSRVPGRATRRPATTAVDWLHEAAQARGPRRSKLKVTDKDATLAAQIDKVAEGATQVIAIRKHAKDFVADHRADRRSPSASPSTSSASSGCASRSCEAKPFAAQGRVLDRAGRHRRARARPCACPACGSATSATSSSRTASAIVQMDIDPRVQGPRPHGRDRAAAAQDRAEGHVHRARAGHRRARRVAKRGLHDPDLARRAGRQPRRDPRRARLRHARLPAAADQRRRPRASKGRGGDLRDVFAPLRADPPRPRARQRRGRRRGATNLRHLDQLAERAQRRARQARRRPRRARRLLVGRVPTRSPPRSSNVSAAVQRAARARCSRRPTRSAQRRARSPTLLGPTAEKLRPAARALDPANKAVAPVRQGGDAAAAQRHPPVRARGAPARARPAPGRDAASPTPTPGPHAGRSRRSTTSSTCSPTTRTAARARTTADRQEGYLFWLAWLHHMATQLFSTADANGVFRPVTIGAPCATIEQIVQEQPRARVPRRC